MSESESESSKIQSSGKQGTKGFSVAPSLPLVEERNISSNSSNATMSRRYRGSSLSYGNKAEGGFRQTRRSRQRTQSAPTEYNYLRERYKEKNGFDFLPKLLLMKKPDPEKK